MSNTPSSTSNIQEITIQVDMDINRDNTSVAVEQAAAHAKRFNLTVVKIRDLTQACECTFRGTIQNMRAFAEWYDPNDSFEGFLDYAKM